MQKLASRYQVTYLINGKWGFEPKTLATAVVLPNGGSMTNDLIHAIKYVHVCKGNLEGHMAQFLALFTWVLVFSVSCKTVCDICVIEQKVSLNKLINGRLFYTLQNFLVTEWIPTHTLSLPCRPASVRSNHSGQDLQPGLGSTLVRKWIRTHTVPAWTLFCFPVIKQKPKGHMGMYDLNS